jgi:uncharacterized protein (TIGR02594 family)
MAETEPAWMSIARDDLGVKEISGTAANKRIVQYFSEAGSGHVTSDEVSWCSAFMNHVMLEAGFVPTYSLAARSWMIWGKAVTPKPGAILVFKRGVLEWQGHVTFYVGETATHYICLGGNQKNSVSIQHYAKGDLLASRWPPMITRTRTAKAMVAGMVSSSGTAGLAPVLQLAQTQAQETKGLLAEIAPYASWAISASIALTLVCFALGIYFRWQDIEEKGR